MEYKHDTSTDTFNLKLTGEELNAIVCKMEEPNPEGWNKKFQELTKKVTRELKEIYENN